MNTNKWLTANFADLKNKIVVVTGTTNGLGNSLLNYLAMLGCEVVCGVRNTNKSNEQIEVLKQTYPSFKATSVELDLCDLTSVKHFSKTINSLYPQGVDSLVLNAGIFAQKKQVLESGFEKHFFVNTISPCLIAKSVIPILNKKTNSSLVFVSSISFNSAKINIENVDVQNENNSIKIYANSKRWLTYFAVELKKELEVQNSNICVNICHPGISGTTLLHSSRGKFSKLTSSILTGGMKLIFPSPQKAVLSELFAISNKTKSNEWIGPKLFNVYGKPKIHKLKYKQSKNNTTSDVYAKIINILDNL